MAEKHKSVLVTGGARSGKSSYALELAKNALKPCFIATGWAGDAEMNERIAKHQAERGEHWSLIEVKTELAQAIETAEKSGADFILVDCLTLWTSNLLMEDCNNFEAKAKEVVQMTNSIQTPVVFVTNEVGLGIVPENKLARKFRDAAGTVNKIIAANADSVVLSVCGIPLKIK